MKPDYKFIVDGEDVTSNIKPYLISVDVKDMANGEKQSDSFSMVLQDVREELLIPELGKSIEVFLGYELVDLVSVGKFIIDSISIDGRPNNVKVEGKSTAFMETFNLQDMQTKKSRTFSTSAFTAYGQRPDGTYYGPTGFLGVFKINGNTESELVHKETIDGKEIWIPYLVPTLTTQEVASLLIGNQPTSAIKEKAIAYARQRISIGLSQYCSSGSSTAQVNTIGSLVTQIANEHGLTPEVDPELAKINLGTVQQVDESDPHLLSRIAEQYGATFKISYDKILFVKKGVKSDGTDVQTFVLPIEHTMSWSYTRTKRSSWKSCTAQYKLEGSEQPQEAFVGYGNPSMRMRNTYKSKEDAEVACYAFLDEARRAGLVFSAKIIGSPEAFAGAKFSLRGFPYQRATNQPAGELTGDWTITSVAHSIGSGGFTSAIEAKPI